MERNPIIHELDEELNIALARLNFWEFCLFYDNEFFSKRAFLQKVAEAFQDVYDNYKNGKAISVSVSMPPRAGKSYVTSLFCAWWLGQFPELSVMRNTCTATLYQKFSYDVRNVVKSAKYRDVFTHVELADDKQNLAGWNLKQSKQVGYFGSGVGGTIIGFGANIAITDDLYRGIEDAMSEGYNEGVIRWKESTHDSRKEKNCPEIYIGTRWSKSDVIGIANEKGKISYTLNISALDEDGNSFCEDVKSTAEYRAIQSDIDPVIWSAEYMQEPIEAKGLLFAESELRTFKPDKNLKFDSSVAYGDIADEGDDYLSCPVGRNIGKDIYITDVLFTDENSEISMPLMVDLIKRNECKFIRIESNSMGAIYSREIRKTVDDYCEVYGVANTSNKHTRILMDSGFIKRHCLFLAPEYRSDDYRKFMAQLTKYLKNGTFKKDDAADSMSGLVTFIRGLMSDIY